MGGSGGHQPTGVQQGPMYNPGVGNGPNQPTYNPTQGNGPGGSNGNMAWNNPQLNNGMGGGTFGFDPIPNQGQTGPNPGTGVNQGATTAHTTGPMMNNQTQPDPKYAAYMATLPSQQQMQQGAQQAGQQAQQFAQGLPGQFNSTGGTGGFTAGVGGGSGKTPSGSFNVGPDGQMMMAGQLGGWGRKSGAPFGAAGGYGNQAGK